MSKRERVQLIIPSREVSEQRSVENLIPSAERARDGKRVSEAYDNVHARDQRYHEKKWHQDVQHGIHLKYE